MPLTDNTAANRFELDTGAGVALLVYRRHGQVLSLEHAEVPAALAGRGVGSQLVRASLELVRKRGERVRPRCSFVLAFMQRHPEFDDLRAP